MYRITAFLTALLFAISVAACSGGYSFVASDTGDYRNNHHGASALPPTPMAEGGYIVVLKGDTPNPWQAAGEMAAAFGATPGHVPGELRQTAPSPMPESQILYHTLPTLSNGRDRLGLCQFGAFALAVYPAVFRPGPRTF